MLAKFPEYISFMALIIYYSLIQIKLYFVIGLGSLSLGSNFLSLWAVWLAALCFIKQACFATLWSGVRVPFSPKYILIIFRSADRFFIFSQSKPLKGFSVFCSVRISTLHTHRRYLSIIFSIKDCFFYACYLD